MAENKSTNALWLTAHLAINTLGFAALLLVFQKFAFVPLLVNALLHGVIDWNIWRGYKWFALRRIKREAEQYVAHSPQNFATMLKTPYFDDYGNDSSLRPVPSVPLTQRKVESIFQNWKDRNLFAGDYWFYATIALDQCLHLVIALWLFA